MNMLASPSASMLLRQQTMQQSCQGQCIVFGGKTALGSPVIVSGAIPTCAIGGCRRDYSWRCFADATNDTNTVTASVSEAVPGSVAGGDCFLAALV